MRLFRYSKVCGKATGLVITGLLWASCGPSEAELIQKKVTERVRDFETKTKENCRVALLTEAEHLVDSILLAEAQQEIRDSLSRTRPNAPVNPPDIPPIDTAEVKPLFNRH